MMKFLKHSGIISGMIFISILLFLSGCSQENLTPYPFKEGDYFIYQDTDPDYGVTTTREFRIEKDGSGFIVRRFQTARNSMGGESTARIKNSEKIYDKYGRLQKLADGRGAGNCKDNFCFLWLRPEKRRFGIDIKVSEIAKPVPVKESTMRDNREVLVVAFHNSIYYYDRKTGLLVERKAYGKLIDTNRNDLL